MEIISQLEYARENQAMLDNCKKHRFPTIPAPLQLGARIDCSKCGASMCVLQAFAYAKGYVAAGGNGADIFPGWR